MAEEGGFVKKGEVVWGLGCMVIIINKFVGDLVCMIWYDIEVLALMNFLVFFKVESVITLNKCHNLAKYDVHYKDNLEEDAP